MTYEQSNSPVLIVLIDTINFAAEKHKNQRRKNAEKTPYINHPIGVMNLISNVGKVNDLPILQAAVLHDTVEDTKTTFDEIEQRYGKQVRDIVAEVTDDKSLPKAERKKLQIQNAHKKSYAGRMVKLADKLYNLRDLIECAPDKWTVERIQGYFVWAYLAINEIRGTNKFLEDELNKAFNSQFKFDDMYYPCLPTKDPSELNILLAAYYANFE